MSKIRVGVVGVGHLGYHHARNYAALEGVALAGVVDTDVERRAKASHDFNAPGFATVAELLAAGVDAVSVAAPTTAHASVTLELLDASVDVLVEKPIAATVAQAETMVAAAADRGRILQVGHIERFNGAVMALMQAVAD
ncbi:MAG: Gfo/Idh/MocA family oxidoreductase, partial [Candidatus Hydrogenedentes bacterium]|nr:Gfo/Idh/MocA family oxidoreductase [Candidatus Hydrogenedentota bacterium]